MLKMKKIAGVILLWCALYSLNAAGQSMHFSQYYNAPMLLNPANTALLPADDFRLGLNYRNQWAAVPVPYNTFSAYADCKVGGNRDNTNHNNWLGIGLAFFNDKAGDGNLSLVQVQGSLAYHLQLSEYTMISLGLAGSFVQRSVNYDNLTFDTQWDGFTFNSHLSNGEKVGIIKASYYTIAGGGNFAWFPNENVYVKLGGSVLNVNTPNESFYKSANTIGMRPIGNLDVVFKMAPSVIAEPSVYYTTQTGASELVAGAQVRIRLSGGYNTTSTEFIVGLYDRLADAVIGVAGLKVGSVQVMASYDATTSALTPYNASYGAFELSLIYQQPYGKNKDRLHKQFTCPRFF